MKKQHISHSKISHLYGVKNLRKAIIGAGMCTLFFSIGDIAWFVIGDLLVKAGVANGMALLIFMPIYSILGYVILIVLFIYARIFLKRLGWSSPGTAIFISASIALATSLIIFRWVPLPIMILFAPPNFLMLLVFYFFYEPVKRLHWIIKVLFILVLLLLGVVTLPRLIMNSVRDAQTNHLSNILENFPQPIYFSEQTKPKSILLSRVSIDNINKRFSIGNDFTKDEGNLALYEIPINKFSPPVRCDLSIINTPSENDVYQGSCIKIAELKSGQIIYNDKFGDIYTVFDNKIVVILRRYNGKLPPTLSEEITFLEGFHKMSIAEFTKIIDRNLTLNPLTVSSDY